MSIPADLSLQTENEQAEWSSLKMSSCNNGATDRLSRAHHECRTDHLILLHLSSRQAGSLRIRGSVKDFGNTSVSPRHLRPQGHNPQVICQAIAYVHSAIRRPSAVTDRDDSLRRLELLCTVLPATICNKTGALAITASPPFLASLAVAGSSASAWRPSSLALWTSCSPGVQCCCCLSAHQPDLNNSQKMTPELMNGLSNSQASPAAKPPKIVYF